MSFLRLKFATRTPIEEDFDEFEELGINQVLHARMGHDLGKNAAEIVAIFFKASDTKLFSFGCLIESAFTNLYHDHLQINFDMVIIS